MKITIPVPAEQAGLRADAFLAEVLEDCSRSMAQKLLEEGCVTCGGKALKKNTKLSGGEVLEAEMPEPKSLDVVAQDIPLDVIYEDQSIIVINKPRGMVVHPAAGNPDGTLVNALLHHCGDSLSGIGGVLRPGIVHRIDKDTSGLLIVAKNDKAHLALSEQLKDHTLSRVYEAVLCGNLKQESGTVCAPIGRSQKDRKKMAIMTTGGKPATTYFETIAKYDGFTHVKCVLETGRTHQIRVHMASLGHPVAGDPVYGPAKDKTGLNGQCLHARRIRFIHPDTGLPVELECPLPDYFTGFLKKISGGRWPMEDDYEN